VVSGEKVTLVSDKEKKKGGITSVERVDLEREKVSPARFRPGTIGPRKKKKRDYHEREEKKSLARENLSLGKNS